MLTQREELANYISDAHKDAYGFRPRGLYDYENMSIEEMEKVAAELSDEVCRTIEREELERGLNEAEFERIVKDVMSCGLTRERAVRILIEAEDLDPDYSWDREHFCYNMGMSFSYPLFEGK